MRLTVVGSSGSVPGPGSAASCYLVEHEDDTGRTWRVLLDLGSGALGPLQRYCDPRDLDAVLLSHLHPDHCLDVTALHVILHYHPDGPAEGGVPVVGPEGVEERLLRAHDPEPGAPPRPGATPFTRHLDFLQWQAGVPVTIGPLTVTPLPVDHPVEAYGLRVEAGGAVLAYSGDTDAGEAVEAVAAGAELFLCEAAFAEGHSAPRGLHMTGGQAGEVATRAGAGRLVVTHIPPWNDADETRDAAAKAFHGPVDIAEPGAVFEIG